MVSGCSVRFSAHAGVNPGSALTYDAVIPMHLTLFVKLKVAQENYEIDAHVNLALFAVPVTPLGIYLDAQPVRPQAIKLVVQGSGNWFDVAKSHGLEDQVKEKLATMFTAEWQKSAGKRLVDVGSMIRGASPGGRPMESEEEVEKGGYGSKFPSEHFIENRETGEGGDVQTSSTKKSSKNEAKGSKGSTSSISRAGDSAESATPAKKGDTLEGSIPPSSVAYYKVSLQAAEEVSFTVYGKKGEKSTSFIEAAFSVQDSEGGILENSSFVADSAGDFARDRLTHTAEEAGDHLFCLRNTSEDEVLVYKLKVQ